MSIARGLTKRIKRSEVPASLPARSQSVKMPGQQIDRSKISHPVALISTTNMLSYNAPDIATMRHASNSSDTSTHSAEDSDTSASSSRSRASSQGSRDTLTDASSVGSSPTSPAPNHLSGYFSAVNEKISAAPPKSIRKSASSGALHMKSESIDTAPKIPERALSHSKRAHERLAQKRSLQNMSVRGSQHSSRSSREHRASIDMFRGTIQEEGPFTKELEQLNEVVEEFGGVVRDAEAEADLAAIRTKNLAFFCAADYLQEIQPLNPYTPSPMAWI